MKRYKQAKKEGLNWQVVLLQDLETDLKILTLEMVKKNVPYEVVNNRIVDIVDNSLKQLESDAIKESARPSMLKFATRQYMEWLDVYGNKTLAIAILSEMSRRKIEVPPKIKEKLLSLPPPDKSESILKTIPDEGYNRAVANHIYNKEYEQKVVDRVNQILDEQAKDDYSARYTVRSAAERQIREEWHQQQLSDLRAKGVKLVWIEEHANCSKRCEPWQAKLYSLDKTYGAIEGYTYQPLENAMDIYETTANGKVYKNGCISGFNCRHKLTEWQPGSRPVRIPADVIERQRLNDKMQRYYERNIRKYECRAMGWNAQGNKKMYNKYKQLAKVWRDKYIKFSQQHKLAYYPSRMKI